MEILSNFISIYCFISFIIGAVYMLTILSIVAMGKDKEPRNKVHFYVARDIDGGLYLYLGKPIRGNAEFHDDADNNVFVLNRNFKSLGLNENDYKKLHWKDDPIEVFVNMED